MMKIFLFPMEQMRNTKVESCNQTSRDLQEDICIDTQYLQVRCEAVNGAESVQGPTEGEELRAL